MAKSYQKKKDYRRDVQKKVMAGLHNNAHGEWRPENDGTIPKNAMTQMSAAGVRKGR